MLTVSIGVVASNQEEINVLMTQSSLKNLPSSSQAELVVVLIPELNSTTIVENSLTSIIVSAPMDGDINTLLTKITSWLIPDGKVFYQSKVQNDALFMSFLLAGLVQGCREENEEMEEIWPSDLFVYSATKPSTETQTVMAVKTTSTWNVAMDGEDDDVMDESTLLSDTAFTAPKDDCEVGVGGKKRACKDCSCGRAEEIEAGNEAPPPSSSCGNCFKGDAFRCGGCPFLGKPAFVPGSVVQLDLDDDF